MSCFFYPKKVQDDAKEDEEREEMSLFIGYFEDSQSTVKEVSF